MSDEKPMTVKERMAALAKASNASAPTPGPSKSTSASPGTSVAQRLAKLNRAGGQGGVASTPGLVRTFTPPGSATSTSTRSPGTSEATAGSSIADRIAMLSSTSGASASSAPRSPTRAMATFTPALARATSVESEPDGADPAAGGQQTESSELSSSRLVEADGKPPAAPTGFRSTSERMESVDSDSGGRTAEISGPSSPGKPSSNESPQISPRLAARMQAININFTSPSINGSSSNHDRRPSGLSAGLAARVQALNAASAARPGAAEPEAPPPPPSGAAGSCTPSRMSPGLAARMQALEGNDAAGGSGTGAVRRPSARKGVVGLPGMGIPLPGVILPGGLSELKRRKQEAEAAERGETGVTTDIGSAAEAPPEQQPGQLQHANLARATMPQRRRPRKAARPFKAAAAAAETASALNTSTTETPSATTTTLPSTGDAPPPQAEPSAAPAGDVLEDAVAKPMSAAQRLAAAAAAERNGADGSTRGESDEEWN